MLSSSEYLNHTRREYALYVMQSRSIPHVADGLKHSGRRVLWTARDGKVYKSSTLAGATMPIHPHGDQSLQGAINTLAAPYGNNIPLLKGDGAFGTILKPNAYGASRYTSVSVSQFTKDVIFRDIEIVPMQENYDGSLEEPKHFLPLIPIALLNPQEGIAVGFASNILPRSLECIVNAQIAYLEESDVYEELPTFVPTKQQAVAWEGDKDTGYKYTFVGSFEKINSNTIKITNLPYGLLHEKYVDALIKMEEEGTIQEFEDGSRDVYDITVKFKRGQLTSLTDDDIIKLLKLENTISENLTLVDFDGERVIKNTFGQLIQDFTDWRLEWYSVRYQLLVDLLSVDIQRYKDILIAIKKNVGSVARKVGSRAELKAYMTEIGIVHVDYVADLPVYRFTEDERTKVETKLKAAENTMKEYNQLLKSKQKRKRVYISELREILNNKNKYYNN